MGKRFQPRPKGSRFTLPRMTGASIKCSEGDFAAKRENSESGYLRDTQHIPRHALSTRPHGKEFETRILRLGNTDHAELIQMAVANR